MTRVRRLASLLALSTAIAVFAAGCHKKVAPPPPPPPPPAPAPAPRPLSEEEIFARKSVDQLNAEHPLDDVYFDLDKSDVREDGRAPLQKDADWLKKWTSVKVTIEGHCDERGSSEYNLGLGSRRGDAVKAYLANLGIGGDRVTVVSKGKEQPVCADHTESCWQQNRRGHFVITAK